MKNLIFSFLCFLCLAFGFTSCRNASEPSPQQIQSSAYYPLQVGNRWRYIDKSGFFGQLRLIRECVGERHFGDYVEYSMIDSTLTSSSLQVNLYTIRAYGDIIEKPGDWLINFASKTSDSFGTHGYVISTVDSIMSEVGLLRNVATIYYPVCSVDGMPVQNFAKNVGMISQYGECPSLVLIGARIGTTTYGTP